MAADSREQAQQIQDLLNGLRSFTDSTYASRVEMERLRDAEMKTRYGFNNFSASTKMGADAVSALAKSATSYASSLYQGQRGFAALNNSLDSVSTAAKMAGGALMLLGGPINMVVGALTMLTGFAIDAAKEVGAVSDASYAAYKSLSEVGAAASDGMTGLNKAFTTMGSGAKDFDKNAEVVRELSRDLSLFGGTVYKGRERFVELVGSLREFREPMMRMGMEIEDANRAFGSYVKLQNRYGFLTGQTTQQMATAAKAYVMEQEALTKLTGLTRREQEALLEQQQSRERYAGLQAELKAKGETKLANTYDSIYIALSKFGPETAQGFIDAVSDPYGFTEQSVKFLRLTGGASAEILDKLRKGEIDGAEAIDQMQTAIDRTVKKFGPIMGQMGTFSDMFGPLHEGMQIAAAGAGDLAGKYRDAQREVERTANSSDAELQKQANMRRKQNERTTQMFQVLQDVMPYVTSALEDFGDVLMNVVDYMLEALDYLIDAFEPNIATKATKQFSQQAFKDATFTQEYLGIGRTPEMERAKDLETKAKRAESLDRMLRGKGLQSGEVEEAIILKHNEEKRLEAIKEKEKLDKELQDLVKEMGLEDIRAKQELRRKDREQRRKEREERRKRDAATRTEGGPVNTPAAMLPPPGSQAVTSKELADTHGLKLAGSRAQRDDMAVSPKLIELAKKIQTGIAGFEGFTAFNDNFHHTDPQYYGDHTRGLALDFKLANKPSREQGQKIIDQLKGIGFSFAKDEYNDPSAGATGPHIHAAIKEFAEGGILRARPGGEIVRAAEGGYDEAFIPLKNGTVPVTLNGMDLDQEISDAIVQGFEDSNKVMTDGLRSLLSSFQQNMTESLSRITGDREALNQLVTVSREMVRTQQETNSLQTQMLRVVSN